MNKPNNSVVGAAMAIGVEPEVLQDALYLLRAGEPISKLVWDNSKLLAENHRLAAENERLRNVIGADAIDREHGMCCDASSQVERLREAAQAVELAFQTLDNGLIETPHWVKQQAMRDAVSQLRAAAKEGGAK